MKAIILALVGLLAGCSTLPQPIGLPPEALLADCPAPEPAFKTNGELAAYALALKGALRACNDDKAALREWVRDPS